MTENKFELNLNIIDPISGIILGYYGYFLYKSKAKI